MQSSDLLLALKSLGYPKTDRDPLWWPNSSSFEVIVGAILTQNTQWRNVEKALENLKNANLLSLEALASLPTPELALLIKPSGFYNTKAKRLHTLLHAIQARFGDFGSFCAEVERDWLLEIKGIGPESVDAILCYACAREEMVVDKYTANLLFGLGFWMEEYHEIKEWLVSGIQSNYDKIAQSYGYEIPLQTIYARFHGKIVEYCKEHCRGKQVDVAPLKLLLP